ncbi:hypothetical protein GGS20DRAFT_537848 [Poronia punctata]|nr:hypothetical protein GGS20DRAFT_537848 [Poronia punctata]
MEKLSEEAGARLAPTFPGPLLLPNDELNWDPEYPPQSFRSWLLTTKTRNKVTAERRSIYVVAQPTIVAPFMRGWEKPTKTGGGDDDDDDDDDGGLKPRPLSASDAASEYIAAFYHGLPVRRFPGELHFTPWEEERKAKAKGDGGSSSSSEFIGLALYGEEETCARRIRTRTCPDGRTILGNRLTSTTSSTSQSISCPRTRTRSSCSWTTTSTRTRTTTFCCGRAYGGSRVCVVSSATYDPGLDARAGKVLIVRTCGPLFFRIAGDLPMCFVRSKGWVYGGIRGGRRRRRRRGWNLR